jgi:DNA-binding response OmpR family regulator
VLVLLVEDDPGIAASSRDGLQAAGFAVEHVALGADALARLRTDSGAEAQTSVDVVVLDLGLPDMDGQDVAREIRRTSEVPIIVVSARGDEVDRVVLLELGADDYLVKPFGLRELVARIRAVARRTQGVASADSNGGGTAAASSGAAAAPGGVASGIQEIGALRIDRRSQRVFLGDTEIALTPKEFGVLDFLAEDPGALRRRTEILERVWDAHWYGPTKTVDAHVAAIRRKLGDSAWIEAVRGAGFRLGSPT